MRQLRLNRLRVAAPKVLSLVLACLPPVVHAQTYSVLCEFKVGNGGTFPSAGVTIDTKRVALYGTTYADGAFASGTVFKLNKTGETVLHSFTGKPGDGEYPFGNGSLTLDSQGNLYGTTEYGGIYGGVCGSNGCGVVFKVDQTGKETVIHAFQGGNDGMTPEGPVALDPLGNVYGATAYGGGGESGAGTVFKVDPSGHETVLYSFNLNGDGNAPYGGVVMDSAGNLYGTTEFGGNGGAGTIFKINPSGVETILYYFGNGSGDGFFSTSSLSFDKQGNLYGTTLAGGALGGGTVFKLTPSGAETILLSLGTPGPADTYSSGVVPDAFGNVYGVSASGGTYDLGTVYKVDSSLNLTVLHSFGGPDGRVPYGNLAIDPSGNFYGTTSQGGKFGGGVIFRIKP